MKEDELQKRLPDLIDQAEAAGQVIVPVRPNDNSDELHAVAIPDAQKDFIEGFMTLAARIGDDIDDDDALEEGIHQLTVEGKVDHGDGGGFSMTNTRHSLLYLALWDWAVDAAEAAGRRRKWDESYKYLSTLMVALFRHDQWMGDTESPEDNQEVLDKVAKAWGKLFARKEHTDWTPWADNVPEWKAVLREYAEAIKGYETGDEDGYKLKVPGVRA